MLLLGWDTGYVSGNDNSNLSIALSMLRVASTLSCVEHSTQDYQHIENNIGRLTSNPILSAHWKQYRALNIQPKIFNTLETTSGFENLTQDFQHIEKQLNSYSKYNWQATKHCMYMKLHQRMQTYVGHPQLPTCQYTSHTKITDTAIIKQMSVQRVQTQAVLDFNHGVTKSVHSGHG